MEPRVRITSDGIHWKTHVYVDGVEIPTSEVRWSVASDGVATATLVVDHVAVDVAAYEVVKGLPTADPETAAARGPAYELNPGHLMSLDEIRRLERRGDDPGDAGVREPSRR
jgi:hypothetical protein